LRLLFAVLFLLAFAFNFFLQFFQLYLIQKFAFTEGTIGTFLAYVGLWVAITQGLLLRPITQRYPSSRIFSVCTFLLSLCFPLLLLPDRSIWLYVLAPLLAVLYGLSQPVSTAILSDLSDDASQGEIMGIHQSVQALAMAMPPLVGGIVAGLDASIPILASCAVTFSAWALFARYFQKTATDTLFHEV
jgi:MFS transporter, DHA1 family, tetracycline resistance protein